ncbi:MAG: PepSY-associated TM region [Candidatus Nitrotoga sp. SPKER]|nr:MAG: PepSY-associated TM region [Candidatus Nitrotoga sp. SPKER]
MNIHAVRRWHGLVGAAIVFFLVYLLVSGLTINHVEILKLDKREVSYPWLMRWYGIHVADPTQGYLLGKSYFSWDDDKWVLDDKLLSSSAGQPVGAVEIKGINYVATATALYLYQSDGQLRNKVEKQSLPAYPILALGTMGSNVMVQTPSAVFASVDGLNWEKSSSAGMTLSALQDLPADVKRRSADILAPSIPLQRILLDMHSGRIFGRYAIWVMDIASLVLLGLGLSGFWLYWRLR